MIRRILIAVDDSPRAPAVVAKGIEIARSTGASVRVYHAVAVPPEFPPAAATHEVDMLPAYLHRVALERLEILTADVRDVPCEITVEESSPAWRPIVDAAEGYDADLVVIGSHGYGFVDRMLGTTATKVVHASTRDVLVVHRYA